MYLVYGSGGLVRVFTPSQPMVTLVSLQPFTAYHVRISARNNAGWGGNSSERNVNTLTRGSVCVCDVCGACVCGGRVWCVGVGTPVQIFMNSQV